MTQLQISLTGKLISSNFDEWKKDLIKRIESVKRDLVTDNDFNEAERHVKAFKAAETSLKNAKKSAINQAQEIQQLFSLIDEVTEKAKKARISLERQIKARKKEIKDEYIQSGIDAIKAIIDEQSESFKSCDLSRFMDRARYESAVYRRAGIRGLEEGINQVISAITEEIEAKAIIINNNRVKLDSLPEGYKVLFQDDNRLVCLPSNELDAEIDKRIARFKSERQESNEDSLIPVEIARKEESEDIILTDEESKLKRGKYRITIQLDTTHEEANDMMEKINTEYSTLIRDMVLSMDL